MFDMLVVYNTIYGICIVCLYGLPGFNGLASPLGKTESASKLFVEQAIGECR